jgi:hypothetical protein
MPRDVQTRWNSTYDMLSFALEYRSAVKSMTQIKDLGLRSYELEAEEWELAQQLTDVLKVCQIVVNMGLTASIMNVLNACPITRPSGRFSSSLHLNYCMY